jgi:hypothetical protein
MSMEIFLFQVSGVRAQVPKGRGGRLRAEAQKMRREEDLKSGLRSKEKGSRYKG